MAAAQRGRRRIDRVTDPAVVADLPARSLTELRTLRNDCQAEETRLSYTRRVLQARLDILSAERERRQAGADPSTLLDRLPEILADAPAPPAQGARVTPMYDPASSPGRRTDDEIADAGSIARVLDATDEELARLTEELGAEERRISEQRRVVLNHLDQVQDALVARYRSGDIDLGLEPSGDAPPGDSHA